MNTIRIFKLLIKFYSLFYLSKLQRKSFSYSFIQYHSIISEKLWTVLMVFILSHGFLDSWTSDCTGLGRPNPWICVVSDPMVGAGPTVLFIQPMKYKKTGSLEHLYYCQLHRWIWFLIIALGACFIHFKFVWNSNTNEFVVSLGEEVCDGECYCILMMTPTIKKCNWAHTRLIGFTTP